MRRAMFAIGGAFAGLAIAYLGNCFIWWDVTSISDWTPIGRYIALCWVVAGLGFGLASA